MSEDERRRRLAAMQGDAQVHRQEQLERHQRERTEAVEEERHAGDFARAEFLQSARLDAIASDATASIEDRIRRNLHTKQRTAAALDGRFTDR